MSAARTVLTVAAALVVVPLAMRSRSTAAARAGLAPSVLTLEGEREPQADPAVLRTFLQGVRGSNAIQCEVILQSFNVWSSSRAPDRDSVAWNAVSVVHRRIDAQESIADLVAAMKSGDDCASRAAARLLGRSRAPSARAELLTALRDDNAALRRLGAIGLGFSDDSTAATPLVRALADRDARVRAAAAWALGAVN
jgi:hypothetical protein